jgi:hypothetical protein
MSKIKTLPNPTRIPMGRLLLDVLPGLSSEAIRSARYRARKTRRPDPYPFVIREPGIPHPLVDLRIYNEQARRKGWPLVRVEEEGGSAR